MCINHIRYYNRWSHSWQYAKCGKCAACQQEKAFKRTQRIKNATYDGYIYLFVTLTYRNMCIPYIYKSELKENASYINIYRDCSVRRVRINADYQIAYKFIRQSRILEKVDCFEKRIFYSSKDVSKLSKLRGQSDKNKVGVLYFKDVQDFEKRLRQNLKRHYSISQPIYTFKVSELGPSTSRPHFHLLVAVPKESISECSRAIVESWPYDSRIGTELGIQIARNASSYVSSYVNRGSAFPVLFSCNKFRPRHSFSKGFGMQNRAFTLQHLISSINTGNLDFITERNRDGRKELVNIMFPKYFLNYYFFKFLGYSRLNYTEIRELLLNPQSIYKESAYLIDKLRLIKDDVNPFTGDREIDHEKIKALINCIELRYRRFIRDFVYEDGKSVMYGLPDNIYSRELFADYYFKVWIVYASNIYKRSFEHVKSERDLIECYYNLEDVRGLRYRSDIWKFLWNYKDVNPNHYMYNLISTNKMTGIYSRMYKRRKTTNKVMAECGFYV